MSPAIGFLVCLLFILAFLLLCFLARRKEKEEWNGGVCKEHGFPWVQFDMDSQGGRMYKCKPNLYVPGNFPCCYVDISYGVDKKPKKKKELKWKVKYKAVVLNPDAIVKIKVGKKKD